MSGMVPEDEFDEDAPVFAIAAAAELSGMHPQTLRQYDRLGLVVPARTQGGSRRYSMRHVHQLQEVARMSGDGMSLPAIARILELEDRVRELHVRVQSLEARVRIEVESRPGARVFAAGATGAVVTLRHGTRVRRATDIVLWRPRHPLPPGAAAADAGDGAEDDGDTGPSGARRS
jgi:MerR family transcriptional regulator, heat shock protein HspR